MQLAHEYRVVSLFPPRPNARICPIKMLDAYWATLPATDGVPLRRSFIPARIEDALPDIMLMERIAPGTVRIRLAGSKVCNLIGTDLRGMPVSALFDTEARRRVPVVLDTALNSGARAMLYLSARAGALRKPLGAHLRLLPLRDHDGQINQLICALSVNAGAEYPHRFQIRGVEYEKGPCQPIVSTAPDLKVVT